MLNRKMLQMLVTGLAVLMLATGSALASSFSFPYSGKVGDAKLAAGHYEVSWQQHSPELTVTVTQGKGKKASVVATVQGRMENRDTKYERNMVVYAAQPDGSQTVSELRIGGTSTAIVFDK
jgi:hypothetical protein